MKHSPFKLHTKSINLLAAVLIGLFIIFPDVVRNMENDDMPVEQFGQFRMPPPGKEPFPGPTEPHQLEKHPLKPMKPDPHNMFSRIFVEFTYFFSLALLLLYINNGRAIFFRYFRSLSKYRFLSLSIITLIVCILAHFIYVAIERLSGGPKFGPVLGLINGMVMFKCFFVGIITILFSQLIEVLFKQHEITLEMERLKSENIRNRFDALTSQINPHFFFNSLNALSGLVRIKDNTSAIKYINELSMIFRYLLKGNWKDLVLLGDEMKFLDAYRYLLQIRYGDRLRFNIKVGKKDYEELRLPYLSLQPLIENVIKHNVISSYNPMTINIFIRNNSTLVVSNIIQKKIKEEEGTGIGLSNLSNRYKLLISKDIKTYISNEQFVIELPLTHETQEHYEGINN